MESGSWAVSRDNEKNTKIKLTDVHPILSACLSHTKKPKYKKEEVVVYGGLYVLGCFLAGSIDALESLLRLRLTGFQELFLFFLQYRLTVSSATFSL